MANEVSRGDKNFASKSDPSAHGTAFLRHLVANPKRMVGEIWFLALVGAAAYAFAYLLPQDFRAEHRAYLATAWTAFMLRTFQFHAGLFFGMFFIVSIGLRRRFLSALLASLVLFLVWPSLQTYQRHFMRSNPDAAARSIRVLSANLLYSNSNLEEVLTHLKAVDPDVVLFQEYTSKWHEALEPALLSTYPHGRWEPRDDAFGLAIFSRLPLTARGVQRLKLFDGEAPQFRAELAVQGRELAIYNIHLLPPLQVENFHIGRQEFADLLEVLRTERTLFIVGGDFNFTETSPQAWALSSCGVKEAFQTSGHGSGSSWPVHRILGWVPGLRIDHLYYSPSVTCTSCLTGSPAGSDHRPVMAEFVP